VKCSDEEAVAMSRQLLKQEGIFVGSSSAMHCVGAVKVAQMLGPGHTIVTLLCDSGQRHMSRLWNPEFLASRGLSVPP
jgi:cysteine synthase